MLYARVMLGLGDLNAALDTVSLALEARPDRVTTFSLLAEILEAAIDEKNSLTAILICPPESEEPDRVAAGHAGRRDRITSRITRPANARRRPAGGDRRCPIKPSSVIAACCRSCRTSIRSHWRAQFGLGRIALQLGQLDAALVSLKEAAHLMPERTDILKSLAETYRLANLPREALETAQAVADLLPGDAGSLLWQAGSMPETE